MNNVQSLAATGTQYVFHKDIIAEFLRWIVRLSPITDELPDLNAIAKALDTYFKERLTNKVIDGMYGIEADELRALCVAATRDISFIEDLNLSKAEREAGIAVNDPARPPLVASSRYFQPKPEHDFIDLDALSGNVSRTLMEP